LRRPRGPRLNTTSCCMCIFRHSLPIKVVSHLVVTACLAMAPALVRLCRIVCAYTQGPRFLPRLPCRLTFISLLPSHSFALVLHRICWRSSSSLSDFCVPGLLPPLLGFLYIFHDCATQAVQMLKQEPVWDVSLQTTTM
jgi:hypothetical protein